MDPLGTPQFLQALVHFELCRAPQGCRLLAGMRRAVRELHSRLCLAFGSRSSSSSSVRGGGNSQAAGARPQQPSARLQQTAAPPLQQQLLRQPSSLGLLGDPVSVPRSTLLLS